MSDAPRSISAPVAAPAPRRRPHRFRQRNALAMHGMHFGPNMTPMVDVVMVILIFFMASAAFLGNEWFLRAALPAEAGRGKDARKPNDALALPAARIDVLLDVDESGKTIVSFLELKRAPLTQFLQRVASLASDDQTKQLEIILRPTPRVPYNDLVSAHAACDGAGIFKVGIQISAARPSPKP